MSPLSKSWEGYNPRPSHDLGPCPVLFFDVRTRVCAYAVTHPRLQYVHHFEGGLFTTAHTSPYIFCPPSSCTYNTHIIKRLNCFCVLHAQSQLLCSSKFRTLNPGCPLSQPHTFSANLLFVETFAQPDVSAVVNCPVAVLSLFCSTVLMRSLIFSQSQTALT